jgi:hypothetical protein
MSKVKTVKDSTARLVRFNSADDNEDDGIRKSRRLRGQDPPLQLDPLNIPLTGPQELRVREEKNTDRGRSNQKPKGAGLLSGLLRRNRTERSKSEDSEDPTIPRRVRVTLREKERELGKSRRLDGKDHGRILLSPARAHVVLLGNEKGVTLVNRISTGKTP